MDIEDKKRSYLHLWKAHSRVTGFGHISLELSNNCYISFWPDEGTKSCQIKNENCPAKWYNSVEDEIKEKGHPTTIYVYGLDVDAIKSWWKLFLSEKPKYDIRDQNCAVVVYKALCEGSSWFEKNTSDCTGIKTPERVFYYVKNGYHKSTKIGCGCSCGHCLSLHPYRCLGFVVFYIYKLGLFLLSIWECIKRRINRGEQTQTDEHTEFDEHIEHIELEEEDTPRLNIQERNNSANRNTVLEDYEAFVDIHPEETQAKQAEICHPEDGSNNEGVLMPSNTAVNARYRVKMNKNTDL